MLLDEYVRIIVRISWTIMQQDLYEVSYTVRRTKCSSNFLQRDGRYSVAYERVEHLFESLFM